MNKISTPFTFRLISILGLLGCAIMPAAAQSAGDILFYQKASGSGYDPVYLTPTNNRVLGFNGSGALTLSIPFSGSFSDLTGKPTTLSGYGITDSVVLTTGAYVDPAFISGLDWSKISGTPTTLSGYGITDSVVLTSGTYVNPGFISSLAWSKIASTPSSLSGYGITDAVSTSRTVNGHALSANVTLTKSDVGLANVANVDTSNATNILSGTLSGVRVQTQMSLAKDSSGIKLNGDALSPGNSMYYGTDGSGAKGFYSVTLPGGSSGDVQFNDGGVLAGLSGITLSAGQFTGLSYSGGQITFTGTISDGSTDTVRVTSSGRTDLSINGTSNISVLGFSVNGVRKWNNYTDGTNWMIQKVGIGDLMTFTASGPTIVGTTIINALLHLTPTTTPGSPSEGDIYANFSDHHLYFYNGTTWNQLDN